MDVLFVFAKSLFALFIGWIFLELLTIAILGRSANEESQNLWPVFFHRHPGYTDEELLQQEFNAQDRNGRHAFYRRQIKQKSVELYNKKPNDEETGEKDRQIKQKAVELYNKGWVAIAWRHIMGHDAVEEEGGSDVL